MAIENPQDELASLDSPTTVVESGVGPNRVASPHSLDNKNDSTTY
jgi:hypothetical protein